MSRSKDSTLSANTTFIYTDMKEYISFQRHLIFSLDYYLLMPYSKFLMLLNVNYSIRHCSPGDGFVMNTDQKRCSMDFYLTDLHLLHWQG